MANTLRPNGVTKESKYTVIGGNLYNGVNNLFDASATTFSQFERINQYVEVKLDNVSKLWTLPYRGNNFTNDPVGIFKLQNGNYVDTGMVLNVNNPDTNTNWYVAANELPVGTYRFVKLATNSRYRTDYEWFFEDITKELLLLKIDDSVLSTKDGISFLSNDSTDNFNQYGVSEVSNLNSNITNVNYLNSKSDFTNDRLVLDIKIKPSNIKIQ
jgi:hypothetical protein